MKIITSYTPDDDNEEGQQSAADAAAATTAKGDDKKPLTPEQIDKQALAAFDHGLKVSTGDAEPKLNEDGSSDAVVVEGDDTVAADKAQPRAKPKADEQQPKQGEQAQADEEEGDEPDEAAEKAAIEQEIKDRGLKDAKTAERFRQLANDSNELKRMKEQHLPGLVEDAEAGRNLHAVIQSTGASPEQMGMALGYLAAVNSGDPTQMNKAFDAMADEVRQLGKRLGRKLEAMDPLEADPELLKRVKAGEVDRVEAERTLRAETEAKMLRDRQGRQDTKTAQQNAIASGLEAAKRLGAELSAAEEAAHPGQGELIYQAKMKALVPSIQLMRQHVAPEKWPEEIKRLYTAVQVSPPPKEKPRQSPVRPGNQSTGTVVAKPKDDVDAFSRGMELAGRPRA